MQAIDVQVSDAVEEAAWIGPRLLPFESYDAGIVIPTGFAAYARIDHDRPGVLPADLAVALVRLIGPVDAVWMALWDGYGFLHPGRSSRMLFAVSDESGKAAPPIAPHWLTPPLPGPRTPRVSLPHRDYLLYRGPIDTVPGWMEGPNLWWPDDRSWCVASDIDLPWTYVGGPSDLIGRVLEDQRLKASPLSLDESTLARDHPELGQPT